MAFQKKFFAMKTPILIVCLFSTMSPVIAQAQTVESSKRTTAEILRSVDSGVAEVNWIIGKAASEGRAVAAIVADEALRTVEGLMPIIVRIGQQTERLVGDAERTLERVSESPELRRAEVQLGEAVKRLEAAAAELEKVGEEPRK